MRFLFRCTALHTSHFKSKVKKEGKKQIVDFLSWALNVDVTQMFSAPKTDSTFEKSKL